MINSKTPGEKLEGIAFTFCKTALLALILQKFTLPVAAGLAAVFFVLAYTCGKKDTRCFARYPLMIAFLWLLVVVGWTWLNYFRG
ncbi:MAG: hypothetical protein U0R49_02840 [Fimbriimonadales bacterium]